MKITASFDRGKVWQMNHIKRLLLDRSFRFSVLSKYGFYNWMPDAAYLKLAYRVKLGMELDIENPSNYNEKLQWLKLHDRNPVYIQMADKYEMREYVSQRIGPEHVVPLIGGPWNRFDEIDFDSLPNQFVLKCTHDSGGMIVCKDKSKLNIAETRKKIESCLRHNYFWIGREWPYKHVKPRIIAEQYITEEKATDVSVNNEEAITVQKLQQKHGLLDYKFMCFDGQVKALFLDIGVIGEGNAHASVYYRNIYDTSFNLLPVKETRANYPLSIIPPKNFVEMIRIAERLSKGFPHLRVDLYNIDGHVYVGELTFFHGSGLTNEFIPSEWNQVFGDWIKLPYC